MSTPVEITHLVHAYGRAPVLALDGLDIPPGRVHLAGPNGAGKTTLLEILATLTTPDQGEVTVAGHHLLDDARAVRAAIGYAGHTHSLHEPLTARNALALHADLHHLDADRVDATLDAWQLADHARTPVAELSYGQARRLDLARAMLHRPQVLLLDEPGTGLDPEALALLNDRVDTADPELVLAAAPDAPGIPTDRTLDLSALNQASPEAGP